MLASLVARRLLATRVVTNHHLVGMKNNLMRSFATSGDSITYSGGQATEGQGGFYGSGGARVITSSDVDSEGRQALLAMAADVEKISSTMDELYQLESQLMDEGEGAVTNKSIELKASIKKLMTAPEVTEALDRLEYQDEPVWGLSAEEREMIILAKQKMNEC